MKLLKILIAAAITASTCLVLAAFSAALPVSTVFQGEVSLVEIDPPHCPPNVSQQNIAFVLKETGGRATVEFIDGVVLQGFTRKDTVFATGRRGESIIDIVRLRNIEQRPVRLRLRVIWEHQGEQCAYYYAGNVEEVVR